MFALALTVFEASIFKTAELENLGQGHVVKNPELMPFDSEYQPA